MTARISLADAAVMTALSLAAAVSYTATGYRTVSWWDSGEIIACTHTLSIALSPGFPLAMIAGRTFDSLLDGAPARDVILFSAMCSAAAVALVAALVLRVFQRAGGWKRQVSAVCAALTVGGSTHVWLQATRAEVYAPALLMVAILVYLAFSVRSAGSARKARRGMVLLAYVWALGLGLHHFLAFSITLGLVLIAVGGLHALRSLNGLGWVAVGAACVLGLSVYLYGPVRAVCSPPFIWGDVSTIRAAISTAFPLTGAMHLEGELSSRAPAEVWQVVRLFVSGFSPVALLLAVPGVILIRRERFLGYGLLVIVVGNIVASVTRGPKLGLSDPDLAGYLTPSVFIIGALAGMGMGWLLERLERVSSSRAVPMLLSGAVCAGLFVFCAGTARMCDRSSDRFADRAGCRVLASAPYRSVFVEDTINLTFVLRAFEAAGVRPDVTHVNRHMAQLDWARARLDAEVRGVLDSLREGPPWSFPRRVILELSEADVGRADWFARTGVLFEAVADSERRQLMPALLSADASAFVLAEDEVRNLDNVRFLVLWLTRRLQLFERRQELTGVEAYRSWLGRITGG